MSSPASTRLSLHSRVILCLLVTVLAGGALLHIRTTRARADREQNRLTENVSASARAIAPLVPAGSTYTWVGGTPVVTTDWTIATNWNPQRLTPAATDNLVFDGSGTPSPTITNIPTETIATLTFTNGVTATFNAASGSQTLTVSGATGSDLSIAGGASLTVAGANALKISVAAGSAASISGNLIFEDGAHRLLGNASASDSAGISFQNGSIFTTVAGFTGNPFGTGLASDGADQSVRFRDGSAAFFNAGSDPFGASANGVVTFTFGSAETFSTSSAFAYDNRAYGNLTLDGNQIYSGGSATNQLTVGGELKIVTGSTLQLSNSAGGDLNLLNDLTVNGALNTNNRTVKFQGGTLSNGATQTIKTAATLGDVIISKINSGGSVKLGGTLTINGAFQFTGTSSSVDVLDLNGNTLNLNGFFSDTSSSTSNGFKGDSTAATLNIGGSGALGTLTFISGSRLLKSLSVDRSSSGTVAFGSNLTIGNAGIGSFTLTNGTVDVGSNTLSLASAATITRTNGYVIGNLQKTFASTGPFRFTVGTANGYSPVDANVTAGVGNSLTVKAVQGKHPNIPLPNALLRYWTITNSGSVTANLTFNYLAGDVVGAESNYKIFKYNVSFTQFAPSSPIDTVNHAATLNGVSSFSDWTLADPALTVNTTVDADDGSCTAVGTGNGCTLREAINAANSSSDPNTINFSFAGGDPGCSGGVCTVSLGAALPDLATDMNITGPGMNSLIVQRSLSGSTPSFRIFTINSGKMVGISGIAITNGRTADGANNGSDGDYGGGIRNNGTLTLTNCSVSNNQTGNGGDGSFGGQGGLGGGIYNEVGGTLTILNTMVSGNQTGNGGVSLPGNNGGFGGSGGGIYNAGATVITNCTITGNHTGNAGNGGANGGNGGSGGGVLNFGTLTLAESTISNNQTGNGSNGSNFGGKGGFGGGIYNGDALTLIDDTISNNQTGNGGNGTSGFSSGGDGGGGGGVANGATLTLINSTINDNHGGNGGSGTFGGSGSSGGGIYSAHIMTLTNSTVSGNQTGIGGNGTSSGTSGGPGGGVYNQIGSTMTVGNCTIAGNQTGIGGNGAAGGSGGGIYNCCSQNNNIKNIIVANNTIANGGQGPDLSGAFNSEDYNLIKDPSGVSFTGTTTHNITGLDPLLGPLGNNGGSTMTRALLPGSPAINAGSNANLPADTFDLDGDSNIAEPLPVDQRGIDFARVINSTVDIGAFESHGFMIAATGGTPQTVPIGHAFNAGLEVTVTSSLGEPVSGGIVTFNPPTSGAGGHFVNGGVTPVTATLNSSGVATSPVFAGNLIAGSYTITATGNGITGSANFNLTNLQGQTTTTVSSSANPANLGQTVTLTATVSTVIGTPTGTVQFKDGSSNLDSPQSLDGSGVVILSTSALSAGSHTISAVYSGDANFLASTGTLSGGQIVLPALSLNDLSATEGDVGTKAFDFTVTLSGASNQTVTVNYATANGTATTADSDYQSNSGTLTFNAGVTTKTITVLVNGDQKFEPNETFFVNLSNPGNATISDNQGVGTIVNDDAQGGIISFSASEYTVFEAAGSVTITVNRSGDTTAAATVDYGTDDTGAPASCGDFNGLASSKCDFTTAVGRLVFAANETQKTFPVLVNRDSYGVEIPFDAFSVKLSNLTGGAVFGSNSTATVEIMESGSPGANAIDDSSIFVRQHYHDFLNREPDAAGLAFWTNEIESCGTNATCREVKRINVSGAFFLSIEFQETGYLVERLYKSAYGDATGNSTFQSPHTLPVPIVRLNEFLADTQEIGRGVVVGQPGWEQQIENNKVAFIASFVQRQRFTNALGASSNAQFVDTLNANAGSPLSQGERDQLVADLNNSAKTRAQVLRAIAEHPGLVSAEFNRAFVLMQFFGYLRRNPDDPQDHDHSGYDFWLTKLNQFGGSFQNAEMVKAFITSDEYRHRFGP